jgi:hypothetical protein
MRVDHAANVAITAFAAIISFTNAPSFADTAKQTGRSLPDTTAIHATYLDGDFDPAIVQLESWLAQSPRMSHSDSIFVFKHLGVMYAARNDTREKGKHYMLRLLEVEPTARILDMYASDMIYMIFKNLREEFEANRAKLTRADGHVVGNGGKSGLSGGERQGEPQGYADGSGPVTARPRNRMLYWLGGAIAVGGAGVATYYILAEDGLDGSGSKKVRYEVK